MKLTKQLVLIAAAFCTTLSVLQAQKFQPGTFSFSGKKTAYVTLKDGTQLQGNIKDLDRKKGLIAEVVLENVDGSSKKRKLKPSEIKHMYLPPSGWDKLGKSLDFLNDATQWDNVDLDKDIIGKGYVFFEQAPVRIGKKTRDLLLQLVNPSFSGKLKVYFDPLAKETTSLGVGGIQVAGGDEKSYFVRKGDAAAYKLKKADYDDEFKPLFEDCADLFAKYGSDPKWGDIEKHVFEYAKTCK